MELTISKSQMAELSFEEMFEVNGGSWGAVVATAGFVAVAVGVCMVVGMLPAVAVVAVTAKTVVASQALIWGGGVTMAIGSSM